MSINHSYEIASVGTDSLRFNLSGLDNKSQSIDKLCGHIFASSNSTGEAKFTCTLSIEELRGLYSFLSHYDIIKDSNARETGDFIEISRTDSEILAMLSGSGSNQVLSALKTYAESSLSESDINTLLGRMDALEAFGIMLEDNSVTEPIWQTFFETNSWILGYGLKYRYLSILQREASVSGVDLDGSNGVISDFLMSDNRFTKVVELKRPDTALFKSVQNRSDAWSLSSDLTNAVSQILSQKANWEIMSTMPQFTESGSPIHESTHDVESILIIGNSTDFSGDDRESVIKKKTFELYRRNMRNIDIILYDELFDRASFIVNNVV